METKIYEVDVQVCTTISVPLRAKDEDDARRKINSEIYDNYGGHKNFLRENSFDFINYSYIDDCDYWNVNDITEDVMNGSSAYMLEDVA